MTFAIRKSKLNDTVPYTFPSLSLDPKKPITLHTRHLGVTNEAFMARSFEQERAVTGYAAVLDLHCEQLAKYCVPSWDNVVDEDGKPVDCSPEKVLAFLRFCMAAEAGRHVDAIGIYRSWAMDADSFRTPLVDDGELGKK